MEDYLAIFNLIGLLTLGISVVWNKWKLGDKEVKQNLAKAEQDASKAHSEVLALYEKQINALKEEVDGIRTRNHELANQMTSMSLKIGKLEGEAKEKDKKIEEFKTIFENRNPEMEKVLNTLLHVSQNLEAYMRTKTDILTEIQKDIRELKLRKVGE